MQFIARFPYLYKFYGQTRKCTLEWGLGLVYGRTMTWCTSDTLPASVHILLVSHCTVMQGVYFKLILFHLYIYMSDNTWPSSAIAGQTPFPTTSSSLCLLLVYSIKLWQGGTVTLLNSQKTTTI